MQGVVGFFLYLFNCKFTKESSSEKNSSNQLRTNRIMVMSQWPRFFGPPCTPCSTNGDTTLMAVTLLILNRFSIIFAIRFSSTFAARYLLKILPHLVCVATLPCKGAKGWIVSCTFFDFLQCGGQAHKVHEATTLLLVTWPDIQFFSLSPAKRCLSGPAWTHNPTTP